MEKAPPVRCREAYERKVQDRRARISIVLIEQFGDVTTLTEDHDYPSYQAEPSQKRPVAARSR